LISNGFSPLPIAVKFILLFVYIVFRFFTLIQIFFNIRSATQLQAPSELLMVHGCMAGKSQVYGRGKEVDITQRGKTKQPWLRYDGLDNQLDYFL
jgi:hypothetical protein